jgi:hypothetical protein
MWNHGKRRSRRGDIDGKPNSEFCSARCSFDPENCHQVALLLAEERFRFFLELRVLPARCVDVYA